MQGTRERDRTLVSCPGACRKALSDLSAFSCTWQCISSVCCCNAALAFPSSVHSCCSSDLCDFHLLCVPPRLFQLGPQLRQQPLIMEHRPGSGAASPGPSTHCRHLPSQGALRTAPPFASLADVTVSDSDLPHFGSPCSSLRAETFGWCRPFDSSGLHSQFSASATFGPRRRHGSLHARPQSFWCSLMSRKTHSNCSGSYNSVSCFIASAPTVTGLKRASLEPSSRSAGHTRKRSMHCLCPCLEVPTRQHA